MLCKGVYREKMLRVYAQLHHIVVGKTALEQE